MNALIRSVLVAGVLLTLGSCGKSYTCSCTTTYKFKEPTFGIWQTYLFESEDHAYSAKMKEKQAQAACDHTEEALHSTTIANLTENGTRPMSSNEQVFTDCKLQ